MTESFESAGRALSDAEDRTLTGSAEVMRSRPVADDVPSLEETSRVHQMGTLLVVIVPFVAFLTAVVLLWESTFVGPRDLALLIVMHVIAAFGITVGFHRMLTHRSFEAKPWVRGMFTVFGSLAIEGRPSHWVADHRRHHAYADEEGDPHSPYVGFDGDHHGREGQRGFFTAVRGAWHAHVGWLFEPGQTPASRFAPDLLKDRVVMSIDRRFGWFVVLAVLIPGLLGFVLTGGSWLGFATGAFWGGLVRIFLTHHITWSVNSICHMFGRREFETRDKATNNWLLALPTMGEAWHHNHHAFPTSAFHGLRRWQKALDPSGWVVWGLEKTGLAWNVKRVSEAQMEAKLASASTE